MLATNPATRRDMREAAHALFARDGKAVSVIRDSGGFVTQRVLATIVNIAADICQQRICTPADLETAVTLGLGYPRGPLAMGDLAGLDAATPRDSSQVLGVIARRQEYVDKNIETLQRQFWNAEAKLENKNHKEMYIRTPM